MNYDVRGPGGNVYAVLGMFRNMVIQLEKYGCDTKEHRKLVDGGYLEMRYDAILDRIEELTNGSVKFVGRQQNEDIE